MDDALDGDAARVNAEEKEEEVKGKDERDGSVEREQGTEGGGEEQPERDWKWDAERGREMGTQGVFQREIEGKQRRGSALQRPQEATQDGPAEA